MKGTGGTKLLCCIQENIFNQHVTSSKRGGTILDLVFGNEAEHVDEMTAGDHFGDSDHNS